MKIYLITNLLNDRQYVGRTVSPLQTRFTAHYNDRVTELGKDMRLHGIDNFSIQLLEEFDGGSDKGRELYWIKHYNTFKPNGYNAQPPKVRNIRIKVNQIVKQHRMRDFAIILESDHIDLINKIARKKGIPSKQLGRQIIIKFLFKNGLIPEITDPFQPAK